MGQTLSEPVVEKVRSSPLPCEIPNTLECLEISPDCLYVYTSKHTRTLAHSHPACDSREMPCDPLWSRPQQPFSGVPFNPYHVFRGEPRDPSLHSRSSQLTPPTKSCVPHSNQPWRGIALSHVLNDHHPAAPFACPQKHALSLSIYIYISLRYMLLICGPVRPFADFRQGRG